jgi:hypothetical protein
VIKNLKSGNKVHAYFAAMGGFAFEGPPQTWFPFKGRTTLTPQGVLFLMKYATELIPQMEAAQIEDKSKADGLAKFVVCTQAIWFCLQCVTRVSQGLAISFLEVNTFGHALCSLFDYTQWWSKPWVVMVAESIKVTHKSQEQPFWYLFYLTKTHDIQSEKSKQQARSPGHFHTRQEKVSWSWSPERHRRLQTHNWTDSERPQNLALETGLHYMLHLARCPLTPNF